MLLVFFICIEPIFFNTVNNWLLCFVLLHTTSSFAVVDCNAPPTLENADIDYTDTHYNSNAFVECNEGYGFETVTGTKVIECTDTGEWTAVNDSCIPVYPTTVVDVTANMAGHETAMTATANPATSISDSVSSHSVDDMSTAAPTSVITTANDATSNSDSLSPHSVSSTLDDINDASSTTLVLETSTLDDLSTAAASLITAVNYGTWKSDSLSSYGISYTSDVLTDTSSKTLDPRTSTLDDLSTVASATKAATVGPVADSSTIDPLQEDSITTEASLNQGVILWRLVSLIFYLQLPF